MARARRDARAPAPYLRRIWLDPERVSEEEWARYPFALPLFSRERAFELDFTDPVTIIVGENGSGKSTLLEAMAALAGFGMAGGARGHVVRQMSGEGGALARGLRAAWMPKIGTGFFFRAETFFDLASYIREEYPEYDYLRASHAEGFLHFFEERMARPGLYIFDEPESALSPSRQIELLKMLHRLREAKRHQVILATHSPLLMALPGAILLELTRERLAPARLAETAHFRTLREFCADPAGFVADRLEL